MAAKLIRKPEDLTASERSALATAAAAVGIPSDWLYALIKTESGWNPQAKNPNGSARGLIQWIDSTARALGYASSLDLVTKHPTRESQLLGPVVAYLKKWTPITSPAALAAVNFFPKNRNNLDAPLPLEAQRVNPGIKTVRDYFEKHMAKNLPGYVKGGGAAALLLLGAGAFF
jgi:soluble lytic murein transglycosylase-like protein